MLLILLPCWFETPAFRPEGAPNSFLKAGDHIAGVLNTINGIFHDRSEAVFILHCFQKKSKSGIATPKEDMDIIRARLKVAEALAKELRYG